MYVIYSPVLSKGGCIFIEMAGRIPNFGWNAWLVPGTYVDDGT